jgi:ribonucleoside-diphosphate reductase alpha chain/ribonucleoside-triphosphate reductase
VEYNCNLVENVQEKEAEELFDAMFNLKMFLSGRTLWVGGTESSKKYPSSNFNCSYTNIEKIDDICEVFYLLMLGCGVGFSALKEQCDKLPLFNCDIEIEHKDYIYHENYFHTDKTSLEYLDDKVVEIVVGDSKEGWVEALRNILLMSTLVKQLDRIVVDYNNVRPEGKPLKTFGGYASGPEPLKQMFDKIVKVIKKSDGKLKPVDILDICNLLGQAVQVGGVRRSAEVCLFDKDDKDTRYAKQKIFSQDENGNWVTNNDILHRTSSNNSILFNSKPTKNELKQIFESIKTTGEPGFINAEVARKRFSDMQGMNPCCEILLPSKGFCNLVEVNCMTNSLREQFDIIRLATRASYRMACVDIELPEWDKNMKENMLLGVSLSGWQDFVNKEKLDEETQKSILLYAKTVSHNSMSEYAKELGRNESKLVTTEKPSGTLSLLPTVSPGIHHSHSPYYIRRVRINAEDPLVKVCEDLGYKIVPEVGQTEKNCTTKVIEFYVKAPEGKTKQNVTAIEQLETYKMFMDNYVDHNASVTVTVKPDEWDGVADWVYNNWDSFVGISFLALDGGVYELMPYEAISEEQYNEYMKNYPTQKITPEMIQKHETTGESDIGESECTGGVCPIR